MHPNRALRCADDAAALARAGRRGFAHIFAATTDGAMVAHAPVTPAGGGACRFHVARGNRIARHLDGARIVLGVGDADGHISRSRYGDPASGTAVPTWNYVAVEPTGTARMLDRVELAGQLDALAALHAPRVSPDVSWTRAKTDPACFEKLLGAIIGFGVAIESVRAATRLSHNKSADDLAGVCAGLERSGNRALAEAMRP